MSKVLWGILAVGLCFAGKVQAQAQTFVNEFAFQARPLPLSAVRVTGGPLKRAQDLDAAYLLQLEPDRMLALYRQRAGLKPKAPNYNGQDSIGRNLTGHLAGHYLSAVSLMYAATGDERFKARADTVVQELREVQDKIGTGYLGALQDGPKRFDAVAHGHIEATEFDLNGMKSPWYVLHKTFAGLRDAYRFTGNTSALGAEIKFATWAENVVSPLDNEQMQKMLTAEFGGMNEVLVNLFEDTGDRRWLLLSERFEHRAVMAPLKNGVDALDGLNTNSQVAKVRGSLARTIATGNRVDGRAVAFFWNTVVSRHSFATGGVGQAERFGPPDALSPQLTGRTADSSMVFNLLKMTRQLFALQPEIRYAEYAERALFNHVLGAIDPDDGRICPAVPVGQGMQREYQDKLNAFSPSVGDGMEIHARHGDGIYYEGTDAQGENRLWVNQYVPSTLTWKTADASLTLGTDFPEGETATLTLTVPKAKNLTLLLRRPTWAGAGFGVQVNGRAVEVSPPGTYVELKRKWKSGDKVTLALPKALHAEPLPDNPNCVAVLWGPLVLGGDLGPEGQTPAMPSRFPTQLPVAQWLLPVAGQPGKFQSVGKPNIDFEPLYRLHHRLYTVYWN